MFEIDEKKRIASEFLDAIGHGRIDEAMALLNDDVQYWIAGDLPMSGTHRKEAMHHLIGALRQMFDGPLVIRPTSMVGEANSVAVEAVGAGKTLGGKPYNNHFHFLFEFDQGNRILALREYMDTALARATFQP
ncbi:hypothetical protein SAMN02927924_01943 [Sphingobium faniae]|nr:hypothetical protein SAMN02927924_01943 [Sphingobium faniae]